MAKKYENLVCKNPYGVDEPQYPWHHILPYVAIKEQFPAAFEMELQVITEAYDMDPIPMVHEYDQFLMFYNCGTNLFDFDTDIEFTLGEIGVDAETYHIDSAVCIHIPAGVYHAPLKFCRIGHPILFMECSLNHGYKVTYKPETLEKK